MICGKEFEVIPSKIKTGRGKYCSKQCYYKALIGKTGENSPSWRGGQIKRVCEVCGKSFEVRPAYLKKKGHGKYCSSECYGKALSKIVGPNHPRYKKTKQICEECGKEFEVVPAKIKMGRGKYCSKACVNKARSRLYAGQNNPLWKPKIKKICQECGVEFEILPSALKSDDAGKYCSRKCGNKVLSRNAIGEKSSNWRGGKTKRICEVCGKEFEVPPSVIKKGKGKYCSKACWVLSFNDIWYGGVQNDNKPYYCEKWNRDLRNRIRAYWGYKSALSGKTKTDNLDHDLSCHHIYYQKKACCVWDEDMQGYYAMIDGKKYYIKGDPNKFVPLTKSEHAKINKNKLAWIEFFENLIETQGGKCYLTVEEMQKI